MPSPHTPTSVHSHERSVAACARRRFDASRSEHASWLDDYALFQALRSRHAQQPWWDWPEPLAQRDARRVAAARDCSQRDCISQVRSVDCGRAVDVRQARGDAAADLRRCAVHDLGRQPRRLDAARRVPLRRHRRRPARCLQRNRAGLGPSSVALGGDGGRTTSRGCARARARTAQFSTAFGSTTLSACIASSSGRSTRRRSLLRAARRADATALGERLVRIYRETGAEIIAEDLGTVPDFVRASLRRLRVPGFKVMRWERRWSEPETTVRRSRPSMTRSSVATTGTHDTEPLASWWESLSEEERDEILSLPSVHAAPGRAATPLDAIVAALLEARSQLAIMPMQDLFGWRDRINTPAMSAKRTGPGHALAGRSAGRSRRSARRARWLADVRGRPLGNRRSWSPLGVTPGEARDDDRELGGLHRLGDVDVEPGAEHFHAIRGAGVGRERRRGHARRLRERSARIRLMRL